MEKFINDFSDQAILKVLGSRIKQQRLNREMTQAGLSLEAGISERTMSRIENGQSVQMVSIIRILRVLDLIDNINALIPQVSSSPLQQLKAEGKKRQRASSRPKKKEMQDAWKWGDDS